MIESQYPDVNIRMSYLQAVLHQKDAIRAMAVQLVAGQVEGHLDMISDAGQDEYSNYKDVAACIAGAKESVVDYVEDLIADFRSTLLEEIAKVKIETKGVILRPDGEIDAEVSVMVD